MKRLLIVCDVYGWAWSRMAAGIAANAGRGVEVTVMDQREFGVMTHRVPFLLEQFDGVCQCSWTESDVGTRLPIKKATTWLASHGFEHDWPIREHATAPERIATRIRNRIKATSKLRQFHSVLCVSDRILQVAQAITNNAVRVVPGVDHNLFRRCEVGQRERLVVGWCGQRAGITKGYYEVLLPLQDMLGQEVAWSVNTRSAQDPLNDLQMVDWFHGIDMLLSTSCSEGFQMPVLEAASCGIPVIATDVGAAAEVVQHDLSGFIVSAWEDEASAARTAKAIAEHVLQYAISRELLKRHGAEARQIVESRFRWIKRAPEWVEAML